jgi:hypothetical protein
MKATDQEGREGVYVPRIRLQLGRNACGEWWNHDRSSWSAYLMDILKSKTDSPAELTYAQWMNGAGGWFRWHTDEPGVPSS